MLILIVRCPVRIVPSAIIEGCDNRIKRLAVAVYLLLHLNCPVSKISVDKRSRGANTLGKLICAHLCVLGKGSRVRLSGLCGDWGVFL